MQVLNVNSQFKVNEVSFADGARTKWHVHPYHQVLVVTGGEGVVATEDEELAIHEGDVVHIDPGTKHWHGAAGPGKSMSHISIGLPMETKTV